VSGPPRQRSSGRSCFRSQVPMHHATLSGQLGDARVPGTGSRLPCVCGGKHRSRLSHAHGGVLGHLPCVCWCAVMAGPAGGSGCGAHTQGRQGAGEWVMGQYLSGRKVAAAGAGECS
jgi:hypothetical protein